MFKRSLTLLALLLLLFFLAPLAFASEVMVSTLATEYGAWGEWQEEAIAPQKETEIESAVRTVATGKAVWRYTRFEYFNEELGQLYAAPVEQSGDYVREGSGQWKTLEVDAALEAVGEDGGYTVYAGGWFNQSEAYVADGRTALMYRARAIRRVTCEVSSTELLLFPQKTRQLSVKLFDGSSGYRWESSNPSVASVDSAGYVTGHSVGVSRVKVVSAKGRVVTIDVFVCEKQATIPEGLYSLRLLKSDRALTVGSSLTSKSDNLISAKFTGERKQRFLVSAAGEQTFMMHPLENRRWYVDIRRGTKGLQVNANVQTHKTRDRTSQYLRAIYVPDGSYIIYPKADPGLVIGAEPLSAGNNVRAEAVLEELEQLDRWVLVKADEGIDPVAPFARPMARDGMSYVLREFSQSEHPGITFGSNGRRVYVLSSARGTVLEVNDGCVHDEPKMKNAAGDLIDPCALDKNSMGNYILIDHGGGVIALYAHLSDVYVKKGDTVRQGSMIARSGATGSTDAVGLYFELSYHGKVIDPRSYVKLPDINKPIK